MKYVVAIIQPHMLDEVRIALSEVGIVAITTSDVSGFGKQKGRTEIYRGAEYGTGMVSKARIDVAVPDSLAGIAAEVIAQTANTGAIGDGKIFAFDLLDAVRIRTGERGEEALGQAA